MILVDTSVWVNHLRTGVQSLQDLLESNRVCIHSAVIGELSCGNLRNRTEVLLLLRSLPRLSSATDDEVLLMIDRHRLMGRGIGYVDAHLLTAAAIHQAQLWTEDKRLHQIALELALAYTSEDHRVQRP